MQKIRGRESVGRVLSPSFLYLWKTLPFTFEATNEILRSSMKKAVIFTLVTAVLCVGQAPVARAATIPEPTPKSILIAELQTGGTTDATQEFVELYNPNPASIDITGWQLQYRTASGTATQTWPSSTTKATLACAAGSAADCTVGIAAFGRLVIAHAMPDLTTAYPMAGGFSDKGGEIRFIKPGATPAVQDYVGYGTAQDAQGSPAPAPTAGQSLKRKQSQDGTFVTTGDNSKDFLAGCGTPSPGDDDTTTLALTEGCYTPPTQSQNQQDQTTTTPGATDTSQDDQQTTQNDPPATKQTYEPVLITEVFPDPAAPQQDSTDEFIELYNPNDTAINLTKYILQAGSNYHYSFTLGDTPLGPHAYLAIPSAVSNVSLSNSGSGVRLIDPNGDIAYEAPNYGEAKEGEAWMLDETGWHWTLSPTPGAANILTVPAPKVVATPATIPKKKPVAAATKTSTKKVAEPKIPSAKKTTAKSTLAATAPSTPSAQQPDLWLLAPIGTLVGGYAVYEYRQDIGRALRKAWALLPNKKVSAALPPGEELK